MPCSSARFAMSEPTVSIVIRNYNYGHFLRDAVDSALAQSYPHVEVIVVDDGSTDDSRSIIAQYGSRIASVLKENGGEGSGVNAGFAASHGDIVIYLDSDDTLRPEAAECAVRAFDSGVVRVQYPLTLMNAEGQPLGSDTPIVRLPRDRMAAYTLQGIVIERAPTSGNAFAREFLRKVLPMAEAEWPRAADAYLCTLATFSGGLATLSQPLGFYRVHASNLTASTTFDLKRVRATLREGEPLVRLIERFAGENGLKVRGNWMLWNPSHVAARLVSLKLEPEKHPFGGETTLGLAVQGIRASVRHPLFTLRKRIFYVAWFTLVLALPRAAVERLMKLKLKVAFEGRFRRVLGTRSRAGNDGKAREYSSAANASL